MRILISTIVDQYSCTYGRQSNPFMQSSIVDTRATSTIQATTLNGYRYHIISAVADNGHGSLFSYRISAIADTSAGLLTPQYNHPQQLQFLLLQIDRRSASHSLANVFIISIFVDYLSFFKACQSDLPLGKPMGFVSQGNTAYSRSNDGKMIASLVGKTCAVAKVTAFHIRASPVH